MTRPPRIDEGTMNFGRHHPEETALFERDEEISRLRDVMARAREGRGGVVAIEGPAGIGKTRLLDEAVPIAEAAGLSVLRARASELEREFGYGVVRQLFEPEIARAEPERRAALLDGAAELAAPALGLRAPVGEPGGGADLRYAVLHGLYWLTANLATEGPLLLAVDDLQWSDEPSLRYLAYLARRLGDLPVALLLAMRPALPAEERDTIEAIVSDAGAALIRPGPLSEDAVGALTRARLGCEPHPDFVAACHRVTRGNALLVEELLGETAEAGLEPDAATAAGLEDLGGERISRRIARRLAALAPGADAMAAAVAVLGDDCDLDAAAALAALDADDARRAAGALVAADLLVDTTELRFRHPLVRAAVADRLPAVEAAIAHGRAARLLAERGAAPSALTSHLAAAAPSGDPWVVETLLAAAREARAQGAPELAAADLRRALAEPPPAAERPAVLRALAGAEHAAGLPGAPEHLREALAATEGRMERAETALDLTGMLAERQRWRDAAELGREALAELGGDDPTRAGAERGLAGQERELALMLRSAVADAVRMDASVPGDEPERLMRLADTLSGETPGERWLLATAAAMTPADTASDHAHAADLMERGLGASARSGFNETGVVSNFIRAGRLDAAERVAARALEEARRRGFLWRYAVMLSMRGWIGLERGDLGEAEADLRAALELEADVGGVPSNAALLAVVLAERGHTDDAERAIGDHGLGGDLPEHQVMNLLLHFRSRVRLAQGRLEEALADSLEVGARYERLGLRRAVPPWRSQAAVLLAGRGEQERAHELAMEEMDLAARWGTPLARGLALRGLGLVDDAPERLADAVDALAESPSRLELARARVDLGAALRRAGRRVDSREPLRLGMDGAHACGAAPLAERARTELLATGARPRRLALSGADALTASERRVVERAAAGLTNRRIAQELFVTTATVETHLRHAFRKLDVRSRAELSAALERSSG
ncbi:MAG TPA: AAA family ATPase [Thermoleophilaceae bacterium]